MQLCYSVRLGVLGALLVFAFIGWLATSLGYVVEDVQVVLFPFICILLYFLPRDLRFRPPLALVALAFFLWLGSVVHLRYLKPLSSSSEEAFVFSRIKEDESGVFVRQILKRYSVIAKQYSLPNASSLASTFSTAALASSWLNESGKSSLFVVRGFRTWLELVINPNLRWATNSILIPRLDSAQRNPKSGSKEIEAIEFKIDWVPKPLLLATLPRNIDTPAEPREFVLHALGWLSQGLSTGGSFVDDQQDERYLRRSDALRQLRDDAPAGLSNGIAAIGQYLQALNILEEYKAQGYQGRERIDEALALLKNAAGYLQMKSDPELFSLVFNNAGVALMSVAQTPEELYKARFWIRVAHDSSAFGQTVPTGAEIAMKNLLALDQALAVSPVILDK